MDSIEKEVFENNVVEVDSLPKYEVVDLQPFATKYLVKRNITTSIWLIIISTGIGFAYHFLEEFRVFIPLVAGGFFLIFTWSYISNYWWYKKSGFALRDRDLIFKRGFLFENTTVVPFNRIQHVSTSRGVLDKFLNLSELSIFTAGGSGSDISLPGLLPETADNLKKAIVEKMSGHV